MCVLTNESRADFFSSAVKRDVEDVWGQEIEGGGGGGGGGEGAKRGENQRNMLGEKKKKVWGK